MTPRAPWLIPLWLMSVVALVAYWFYVNTEEHGTSDWVAAPGVVALSSWRPAGGQTGLYVAWVEYTYEFHGRRYNRTRSWPNLGTSREAKQVVTDFPRGAAIEVYVSPNEPSVAVLQRGMYPQGSYYWLEDAVHYTLFMAAGFLTLLLIDKGRPRGEEAASGDGFFGDS